MNSQQEEDQSTTQAEVVINLEKETSDQTTLTQDEVNEDTNNGVTTIYFPKFLNMGFSNKHLLILKKQHLWKNNSQK